MTNKLYIIVRDIDENDAEDPEIWSGLKIFNNLNEALKELDNIYKNNPLSNYYSYRIKVYIKNNDKYISTHQTYYHQKSYS